LRENILQDYLFSGSRSMIPAMLTTRLRRRARCAVVC
jgi:hypothetical protein